MSQPQEQPNAAWARYYAGRGWKIIPIHVKINGVCSCRDNPCGKVTDEAPAGVNAGKHPVQRGWTQPQAWCDSEAKIHNFWGDPRGMPYSMGIVTGSASGVWILDVDPRNGGRESLEQLELDNHDVIPKTLTAVTGSGGTHYYFKVPPGAAVRKGPLDANAYPGIDVQGDGAQAVIAPSMHASGRRYAWDGPEGAQAEVVEAPAWLWALVDKATSGGSAGSGAGSKLDIDRIMESGVSEGGRNATLHKVACSFARKLGVETTQQKMLVISAVEAFDREFSRPPIGSEDPAELKKIIGSAMDFIARNPSGAELDPRVSDWLEGRGGSLPAAAGSRQPQLPPGGAMPEKPAILGDADDAGGGDAGDSAGAGDANAGSAGGNAGGDSGPPPGGAGGGGGPALPGGAGGQFGPGGLPPDPDSLGPDGTPGDRTYTDNGNARRLVDSFEDDVRYTPGLGWYRWGDITWREDVEDLHVTALARDLPPIIVSEVVQFPQDRDRQTKILKHATDSKSNAAIRKAVALANTDPRIQVPVAVWDSDASTLGVANGVVDLRTGRLVPPSRSQYITKRTAVEYRPGTRDTRFEIWLDQVTDGNKDTQRWLQRWAGYCLTGEVIEEKFLMLYGPAGTGKSTFLELVKAAAGDYGIAMQAENITQQKFARGNEEYYNAQIYGKRVIVVSELLEAEQMKEDSIKRLTGADSMVGRHPAGKPFQFKSLAKLMIGTNNRPRVRDNAMWRRLRLLPFLHVPQVLDPGLKPYLLDPDGGLPAFLAWAVEGAVAWYMTGLGTCGVIEEATAEYREAEDEIGIFLREELRQGGDGTQVAMGDVYQAWRAWQEDRGIQNPGHINKLARALGDRGLDVEGTGRRAVLLGWTTQPRAVSAEGSNSFADLVGRARF